MYIADQFTTRSARECKCQVVTCYDAGTCIQAYILLIPKRVPGIYTTHCCDTLGGALSRAKLSYRYVELSEVSSRVNL